jgi:hypothetical protein
MLLPSPSPPRELVRLRVTESPQLVTLLSFLLLARIMSPCCTAANETDFPCLATDRLPYYLPHLDSSPSARALPYNYPIFALPACLSGFYRVLDGSIRFI